MKLEKLKVLDKMNERLSNIEYEIKDIKGNVAKLEEGLNSVNSDVAEMKQDLEKKAEKEKLEELENEVEKLRNRSRRNNLVFYNVPEKAEGQESAEFIQDLIATHMRSYVDMLKQNVLTVHQQGERKLRQEKAKTHSCSVPTIHR